MRKKISRKTDKLNKITTTQPNQEKIPERKMSIALLEAPIIANHFNEEKNIESTVERTESEENLLNAKQETENLRNKLKQKNEEFEANKKKNESELLLINQNIKEKSEILENVSNNTQLLINKLNILNNQINQGYNKVKIFQAANKIKMNYLNELKLKDIKRVEKGKKIILMNNKIIDKFKLQKEKLEKIIEEDTNLKINDYRKNLENLKNKEKDITKEIQDLKQIKTNHEKCIQKNEELNIILERIRNEYNNEFKLKNEENKKIEYIEKDSIENSALKSLPKIISSNNLTVPSNIKLLSPKKSPINSNNSKIQSRNYRSLTHLFGEDYFIQQDLKEVKNQVRDNIKSNLNIKLKRYITSYNEDKKKNNYKKIKIIYFRN